MNSESNSRTLRSTGNEEVLLQLVRQLMNELHPNMRFSQPITLDSSLDRDLGLDSLARVEELCETPIAIISTGPDRAETIILKHPFE